MTVVVFTVYVWSCTVFLLLHTKGDGLDGGSEPKQPISIELAGLGCR